MSPLPISVITGFLGSGKTTLLSRLLRDPALARTAVIVNEFGEVGLDHLLVEASDEEVVLLEGGCLCCKVRGDLVRTAGELLTRRARGAATFDRIVVETTGLADPAPILQALMTDREVGDALRLESVIATVDCAAGGATLDAHPQSVKQAALADRIVLTKADLADPGAGLAERVRRINPSAPQLVARHGAVDASLLFNSSVYEQRDPAWYESHAHANEEVQTFCLRRKAPLHAVTLSLFLQVLAEHCGAKLLRLKGLVDVVESPGRPAVIHGVQHVFHPPAWLEAWPDDDRTTRIVVISQGLDAGWLQDLLEVLDDEVKACSIS
jgi:G3E family GTPase